MPSAAAEITHKEAKKLKSFTYYSRSPHNGVVIKSSGLFVGEISFINSLAKWNTNDWHYWPQAIFVK